MTVSNTLAYYDTAPIAAVNIFIALSPGAAVIDNTAVMYCSTYFFRVNTMWEITAVFDTVLFLKKLFHWNSKVMLSFCEVIYNQSLVIIVVILFYTTE